MHNHFTLLPLLLLFITSSMAMTTSPPPTPPPTSNLTAFMSKKGCNSFSSLLLSTSDAASTIQSNVQSGLTLFCPSNSALTTFLPTFKNLSSDDKLSLLLFHGIPVYYSFNSLQSNNGVMNTLATDGTTRNFNLTVQNDGQSITLKTKISTARIDSTVLDEDTVAVYEIDSVLKPVELFKPAEVPVPAPAPEEKESDNSPVASTDGRNGTVLAPSSSLAPGKPAADQKADEKNSAATVGRIIVGMLVAVMSFALMN